jgi:hypothetical protein
MTVTFEEFSPTHDFFDYTTVMITSFIISFNKGPDILGKNPLQSDAVVQREAMWRRR